MIDKAELIEEYLGEKPVHVYEYRNNGDLRYGFFTKSYRGHLNWNYRHQIRVLPRGRICDCGFMIERHDTYILVDEYPFKTKISSTSHYFYDEIPYTPEQFTEIVKNHMKKSNKAKKVICSSGWYSTLGRCKPMLRKKKHPCKTKPKIVGVD